MIGEDLTLGERPPEREVRRERERDIPMERERGREGDINVQRERGREGERERGREGERVIFGYLFSIVLYTVLCL